MIAVQQTKFGYPLGNCHAACVASVLDLSIDDVPNFSEWYPHDDDACWQSYIEWIQQRNYRVLCIRPYNKDVRSFLRFVCYGEYVIVGGKSPRGDFDHAVVGQITDIGIEIVHDPHPDNTGIESMDDVEIIFPDPST